MPQILQLNRLSFHGFWEECLSLLRLELSEFALGMWFQNIELNTIADGVVYLTVPHELAAGWLEKHYGVLLRATFKKIDPAVSDFKIRISSHTKANSIENLPLPSLTPPPKPAPEKKEKIHPLSQSTLVAFYPDYSFEQFVEGECNRIALSLSRMAAKTPGENKINPLVLYGGTGLGKTHLLQSIGRFAVQNQTARQVVYKTAEQFLKDFIRVSFSGDRKNSEKSFREVYLNADLLLIDDIQVLAGKESTQEELFKVLTRLTSHGKQVVITCDRNPGEVPQLSRRLLSRFECGIMAPVHAPDFATRMDILRSKAKNLQIEESIREEIFCWMASCPTTNVREMEGMLTKLLAYHELMKLDFSMDTVKFLFRSLENTENRPQITVRSIIDAVARVFEVPADLFSSKTRIKSVSLPRKIAMFLSRELTPESYQTIGLYFNRDYATVIAAVNSIKELLLSDSCLFEQISQIRRFLSLEC